MRRAATGSPRPRRSSSASTSPPSTPRANAVAGRWMEQAGLRTWQDAAGNQCGRREGATPGLPALLLGSHLDTVPDAGSYDGMLGVVMAIAVAERLRDRDAAVRARGDRLQRRGGHPLRQGAARQSGRRRRLGGGLVGPARPRRRHAAPGVPGVRPRPAPGRRRGAPARRARRLPRGAHRAGPLPRGRGPLARLRHHDRRRAALPAQRSSARPGTPAVRRTTAGATRWSAPARRSR